MDKLIVFWWTCEPPKKIFAKFKASAKSTEQRRISINLKSEQIFFSKFSDSVKLIDILHHNASEGGVRQYDFLFKFFFFFLKQDKHKLDSNKDIFYNKHKFKAMYMYLRQVSGRGHRTQEPFGSTFNAPYDFLWALGPWC